MKRALSFSSWGLVAAGTSLIAGTYGLVRLAYGLLLPDISASLDMDPAAAGYISAGASAAYCVGALLAMVVPHRPRTLVVGAASTAAAGSVGMALVTSVATFAPAAVLASAGAGLASPGLVAVVARNVTAVGADRAQATVNAGTGPGLVAAGLLALVLPDWRAAFVVAAAFTTAAGVAVLVLDRGRTSQPAARGPAPVACLVGPAAGALLVGTASAVVWTYGRTHLVEAGLSDRASVLAWVALGLGGTASVLTARRASAWGPARAWAVSVSGIAVSVAALAAAPGVPAVGVVACGVFGWGFVAASSAMISWVVAVVPDRAASGTSVVFVALVLGQVVGSAAAGALADRVGLPVTFLLAAFVAAIAVTWARWAPTVSPAGG
jgi:predicted MFS family arabinose efflux permease